VLFIDFDIIIMLSTRSPHILQFSFSYASKHFRYFLPLASANISHILALKKAEAYLPHQKVHLKKSI
jgi:hypothetical protein